MQSHTATFIVDAPPQRVWGVLHPPAPPDSPKPRIVEFPNGRIEILNEGDEAGEGLVRICEFPVPRYLLSAGRARSWETVVEARLYQLSRYVAISKPLWSRAEGSHELEELDDGTTRLTFRETYHAYNPILRRVLERRVHARISRDNVATYSEVLKYAGPTRLLA